MAKSSDSKRFVPVFKTNTKKEGNESEPIALLRIILCNLRMHSSVCWWMQMFLCFFAVVVCETFAIVHARSREHRVCAYMRFTRRCRAINHFPFGGRRPPRLAHDTHGIQYLGTGTEFKKRSLWNDEWLDSSPARSCLAKFYLVYKKRKFLAVYRRNKFSISRRIRWFLNATDSFRNLQMVSCYGLHIISIEILSLCIDVCRERMKISGQILTVSRQTNTPSVRYGATCDMCVYPRRYAARKLKKPEKRNANPVGVGISLPDTLSWRFV